MVNFLSCFHQAFTKSNMKSKLGTMKGNQRRHLQHLTAKGAFTLTRMAHTLAATADTAGLRSMGWDIAGKTCIVTGGNSGIGLHTAIGLARRGARVILGCRNGQAAEEAVILIRKLAVKSGAIQAEKVDKMVTWSHLDLGSMQSVRRFAQEIMTNEKQLNVLINNAAVISAQQRQVRAEGQLEETFATNHLGHFLLTNLLLDLLKASVPSRVVVVASDSYKMCSRDKIEILDDPQFHKDPTSFDPWTAYCQSKLANILFARTLHWKLNGDNNNSSGVSVFTVQPGLTKTNLFRNQPKALRNLFGFLLGKFAKSAAENSETSIFCASQPGLEELSGLFFSKCKVKQLEPIAKDDTLGVRLWHLGARLTDL